MKDDRNLSPTAKRRRRIVADLEVVIFAAIVVAMYIFTGLCLRWAGVA